MKPETIKKMCELAEGFEVTERQITVGNQLLISRGIKYNINSCETTKDFSEVMVKFSLFPLLVHRAWEKVNNKNRFDVDYEYGFIYDKVEDKLYRFDDYQPTHLTQCEQAIKDCLEYVLEKEIG